MEVYIFYAAQKCTAERKKYEKIFGVKSFMLRYLRGDAL